MDQVSGVYSAECTGCMECVSACPVEGALQMSFWNRRPFTAWMLTAGIAVLFFGIVGFAKWNKTWGTDIPDTVYDQLLPRLDRLSHP